MDFLDNTVKVDTDHSVHTTLYTKTTDTHTNLHYTSTHQPHQKISRPYSQLIPVKQICSKQSHYDINSENKS